MSYDLSRRLAAEALGTFFLVMAVVGSGIMAQKLAGGNQAIALLCNTLPTGAVLFVIITIFISVSGAHFNPAVSLVMWLRGDLDRATTLAYIAVPIVGGCLGAISAHLMFGARAASIRRHSAHRLWPVARRVHRHFRPDRYHPGLRALQAGCFAAGSRPLHHLRLLVHLLDIIRQPSRDHRSRS
jgi:glycerol uptake facilitator-like aquaporin